MATAVGGGLVALSLLAAPLSSAEPGPMPRVLDPPFGGGETAVFDVSWGMLKGGEVTLSIAPDSDADTTFWRVDALARTAGVVRPFYPADDTAQAWIDQRTFLPRRLEIVVDERAEKGRRTVRYEHGQGIAHYHRVRTYHRKRGPLEEKREDPLDPGALDVVSALYRLRMLELVPGASFRLPVHEKGKNWYVRVKVGRPKAIDVGGRLQRATPLAVQPIFDEKLRTDRDIKVWIGDEPRRPLLRFEARFSFGRLRGELRSFRYREAQPAEAPTLSVAGQEEGG